MDRMQKLIRARRERQVRKLDIKIEKLAQYIRGLDEEVHPDEIRYADEQRMRAWHKHRAILAKLPKEN